MTLQAPQPRSDFASDSAYQLYLDGIARVVGMLFAQRCPTVRAFDGKSRAPSSSPQGAKQKRKRARKAAR